MPSKKAKTAVAVGAAAAFGVSVVAAAVPVSKIWEGTDLVAKRDWIGTGNPITYCHGMTSRDGAVKLGQRFTMAQCDALLAKTLPTYWANIAPCIKREIPVQTGAALLDAALNAGETAVCRSPMLASINAGNIKAGCEAFSNWYITTKNHGVRSVVPGLINRRGGNPREKRITEKTLCLQGLTNPPIERTILVKANRPWWQRFARLVVGPWGSAA